MKKMILRIIGGICVGLGALGAVVPLVPAFPFLMLAAWCFARSSEKLDRWFRNTRLYRENLKSYADGKGMTRKAKLRIMGTVTALMSVGFVAMGLKGIVTGCLVLGCVWVFHVIYFVFGIRTISPSEAAV